MVILRPSVIRSDLWNPTRPKDWDRISKAVRVRDDHTCQACGHRALKYMNAHHRDDSASNDLANLVTLCVACHAVLHIGRNMSLQPPTIEIWNAPISQVEIVRRTRDGIRRSLSLADINNSFRLKRGPHAPNSIKYANNLLSSMGSATRAYLPEPLCAIFVNFKRWQID